MLNGLDLFSGYGGLTLALEPWVRPIAYCENERYAQAILLSKMGEGLLPNAPIWDDVTTLAGWELPAIDIIYGGFPCQDISVAGNGDGLGGERSGLFFEIIRLAQEIKPKFLFLENVPAIRTRGLSRVIRELARIGYDSRWGIVSAAEMGAPHRRERWFLLAHADSVRKQPKQNPERQSSNRVSDGGQNVAHSMRDGFYSNKIRRGNVENNENIKSGQDRSSIIERRSEAFWRRGTESDGSIFREEWWTAEPDVGRVVNGCSFRMDRIKALGNGVVPAQAREAFCRLIGIERSLDEQR